MIPLKGAGDEKELKRPAIPRWEQYQKVPPTEELVRLWWKQWPDAGIAILTGSVSGLVVLDLDGPRAADLLTATGLAIPSTAAVATGNGFHAYFLYDGKPISNRTKLLGDGEGNAIDVRGEGGYVVAPPSMHGSGKRYRWVRDLEEILALPSDLEEFLLGVEPEQVANDDWFDKVIYGVESGSRNDAAARVAGYWMRMTDSGEATLRATLIWNRLNKPPLPEDEIYTTVNSVVKRHTKNGGGNGKERHIEVMSASDWAEELRNAQPRRGTDTGLPGLDMVDGLVPGDLITFAGRPGIGKSTWATQLTAHAIQRDIPTLVISSEMTRGQWGRWTAAVLAGEPARNLPRPLPDGLVQKIREAPLRITDVGTINVAEIRKIAEGTPGLKLVIVDHLTRIRPENQRADRRDLEVGDIARGLKSMAKDLGLTSVVMCQLNRAIENRESRRPQLSDLRDSGVIEEESDAVFFLYSRAEIDKAANERTLSLVLEKFRHGPQRYMELLMLCAERKFVELAREL